MMTDHDLCDHDYVLRFSEALSDIPICIACSVQISRKVQDPNAFKHVI